MSRHSLPAESPLPTRRVAIPTRRVAIPARRIAIPARRIAIPAPSSRHLGLAALSALLLLAGCSSSDSDAGSETESEPAATASGTSAAESTVNPCDSLDAAAVSAALGATVTAETGTTDTPRCALLPAQDGDPTFEMSYLWFDQGLDAAWQTIGADVEGTVSTPEVAGADDVRVVVNSSESAYAVSAFLQNGDLIQTVNALALDPTDGPAVDAAVTEILTELSAGAPSSSQSGTAE